MLIVQIYVPIYLSFWFEYLNKIVRNENYEVLILTTFDHTINLTDMIFILAL